MTKCSVFLSLAVLLLPLAPLHASTRSCFIDTQQPSAEIRASRMKRAADVELKATKLIKELTAEVASSTGARRAAAQDDLKKVEAAIAGIRKLKAREYCQVTFQEAAAFVREVTLRIEECGTRNFPVQNGKKLYGAAEAEFVLGIAGDLVSDRILQSSKLPALDSHVLSLVRASALDEAVPQTLAQGKFQNFVFRSRFNFVHGDFPPSQEPAKRCNL